VFEDTAPRAAKSFTMTLSSGEAMALQTA